MKTALNVRERHGDPAETPVIERIARSGVAELRLPSEMPDLRDMSASP